MMVMVLLLELSGPPTGGPSSRAMMTCAAPCLGLITPTINSTMTLVCVCVCVFACVCVCVYACMYFALRSEAIMSLKAPVATLSTPVRGKFWGDERERK